MVSALNPFSAMKKTTPYLLISCFFLIFSIPTSAQSPRPSGPTNITALLEKAGQFTTFMKLLKSTQEGDQINMQLNNSNQGLSVFAPTDNAFMNLKPGTLNSLTDQQKVQLIQFHVVPSFLSISQFQTVSNPLRTQAGNNVAGEYPLNVTTSGNQVNITTGVVSTTLSNTIYTDGQLALYQVDQVLLPLALFGTPSSSPAPAPAKSEKAVKGSDSPSDSGSDATINSSDALGGETRRSVVVALIGVVVWVASQF